MFTNKIRLQPSLRITVLTGLILISMFGAQVVSAEGEALTFLSEDPIVLRMEKGDVTFPLAVQSAGTESIDNITFNLLLTYIDNGQERAFDGLKVSSSVTALPPNTTLTTDLTFSSETGVPLPDGPLNGYLVMNGSSSAGAVPPATLPITINPAQAAEVTLSFPAIEQIALEMSGVNVSLPVTVSNGGAEPVENLAFGLMLETTEAGTIQTFDKLTVNTETKKLPAYSIETVNLTFSLVGMERLRTPVSGILLVKGNTADGTPIPTVTLPVEFKPPSYRAEFIYSVLLASAFLSVVILILSWARRSNKEAVKLDHSIKLEGWSQDSWLSIFTAGTGLLGLGFSLGILPEEMLTTIPTGQFKLLWAFFAVLIPIAPLFFYMTIERQSEPTTGQGPDLTGKMWGFLLTILMVFWGASGQVLTMGFFAYALATYRAFSVPPAIGIFIVVLFILILSAMLRYGSLAVRWEVEEEKGTLKRRMP